MPFLRTPNELAQQYREIKDQNQADITSNKFPENWADKIYIALGLLDKAEDNEIKNNATMTETFNKIKQCFMLIEDLESFLKADPKDTVLRVSFHSREE